MKRFQLKSLTSIFLLVVIVVPLVVVSLIAVAFTNHYILDVSKEHAHHMMNTMDFTVRSYFDDARKEMGVIKETLSIHQGDFRSIELLFEHQDMFEQILMVNEEGKVIDRFPKNHGVNYFDYSSEETFKSIMNGNDEAWSKTYEIIDKKRILIHYGIAYQDQVLIAVMPLNALEEHLLSIVSDKEVLVALTDSEGLYLIHSDPSYVVSRQYDPYVSKVLDFEKVHYQNDAYYGMHQRFEPLDWQLVMYEPMTKSHVKLKKYMVYLCGIIAFFIALNVVMGHRLIKMVFFKLNDVVLKTKTIAAGHYTLNFPKSSFIEFQEISNNFIYMAGEIQNREEQILRQHHDIERMNKELEHRVNLRTYELYQTNQELQITLENLKLTQEQLVESEKLASLGDLVAGLAHEINTPLGIILTIVTYMEESTKKMKVAYDQGLLKKGDFEKHLESIIESETLIHDNVSRAIELISSFKMISAEQRSLEKRTLVLSDFLYHLIKSIEPQMKKSSIQVRLHCDENIEIETIPLTLYQILINILMNTRVHAYENFGGYVDVSVFSKTQAVEITVEDYGVGIPKEYMKKIFDPFFTTKRGTGGTGLGLSITYNSIKQNLQGEIYCTSEVGGGTKFVLTLPINMD